MLHRALVVSGVAAVAAILSLAAVVMHEPGASPSTAEPVSNAQVSVDESELPDPAARGVVILSADWQLYSYTPDGEASGGPFAAPYEDGVSPDGLWQALKHCPDAEMCKLVIVAAGSRFEAGDLDANAVELGANFASGEWARSGAVFAALDESGSLYLVEPAGRSARVVQACCVTAYAWTADDTLLIGGEGKFGTYWLARAGIDEPITEMASVASPVTRFYESPDGLRFAFAQSDAKGLGLMTIDTASGRLTDYGVLHGPAGVEGPQFAIAWSHDQRYVAVGPVAAPYRLFILDTRAGEVSARHDFEEGYAGELVWSPIANRLAISTYSPGRLRHEVYVVDTAGDSEPRHLLAGCRIVWSPDGRFLAAKAEPQSLGAAAVNVDTGRQWQIAPLSGLTPVAWGIDEAAAIEQIQVPGRSAAVLGK